MGPGWYHCKDCRKKFTAAVGTIYERSHIPMTKWLLATHLMCASKKAMSAHQLERMLGLPYKTAWFMAMRIREGMRELNPGPMGGEGSTAEIDETYVGGFEKNKHADKRPQKQHMARLSTKSQSLRSWSATARCGRIHVPEVTGATRFAESWTRSLMKTSILMTDGEGQYRIIGALYRQHECGQSSASASTCAATRTRTRLKATSRS